MAKKREKVKMKSSESPFHYYTEKNKTNTPDRMEFMKYDPSPQVRKHVMFKEAK